MFLPNSPLIASLMSNNFSFPCFECNEQHMFQNEMDTMVFSQFHGVFVFPHLEDVQTKFLHIDLAYALYLIYLCYANGVVNKNGHVIHDVLLYHAQTKFAWSLLCEGTSEGVSPSMENGLRMSFNEQLLHRICDKVTSFYLRTHAMIFEHWLLFECCFAFVVSFIGFLEGEGTFKSCQVHLLMSDDAGIRNFKRCHLPPLHDDTGLASRMTLFQGIGRAHV